MPFPIAHALVGASVVAAINADRRPAEYRELLLAGAVLAVVPDLDYLAILVFGLDPDVHRGVSHSITFAVAVGLLCFLLAPNKPRRVPVTLGLALMSHGVLDAMASVRSGAQLLWPLTHRFALGVGEYPETMGWYYVRAADVFEIRGVRNFLAFSAWELLICGSLFLAVLAAGHVWRRRTR